MKFMPVMSYPSKFSFKKEGMILHLLLIPRCNIHQWKFCAWKGMGLQAVISNSGAKIYHCITGLTAKLILGMCNIFENQVFLFSCLPTDVAI